MHDIKVKVEIKYHELLLFLQINNYVIVNMISVKET